MSRNLRDLAAAKDGIENADDFWYCSIDVAVAPEISKDFPRQEVNVGKIKTQIWR